MANPLTFLLPFRYDAMGTILVVQSGPIELAVEVAARLRTLFPGCKVEGLIRDNDVDAVAPGHFDRVTPVRWEDRIAVVRAAARAPLRRRRRAAERTAAAAPSCCCPTCSAPAPS